jgi:hypothetical protein
MAAVLLMTLSLTAAGDPSCAGCGASTARLVEELVDAMDELSPDIDALDEILEREGIGPLSASAPSAPRSWVQALVPSIGLRIVLPSPGRALRWEVYLLWEIAR